ncbi:MAG TPA: choice-of-anchor L domain-containing protein, partial [Bacteroidales bacterium]|nr:choice-of-anchor L domain-containing protein [Bacteroidales bacterium]
MTGTDGQIGSFTGGNSTNLGINQGIVMASGFVKNVPGAVGTTITDYSDAEGDADLQALIGGNTSYQAAVLEFDFMATANTVSFRYVFGSEEYP